MIGPHFSGTSAGGKLVRCGMMAFNPKGPTEDQQKKGLLKTNFFLGCAARLCVVGGIIVCRWRHGRCDNPTFNFYLGLRLNFY